MKDIGLWVILKKYLFVKLVEILKDTFSLIDSSY